MYNGHTLVEFLAVYCNDDEKEEEGSGKGDDISVYGFTSSTTQPLERDVDITGVSQRRKKPMSVIHKAMEVVVRPLQ